MPDFDTFLRFLLVVIVLLLSTVIFVTLKLTGQLDWHWALVVAPVSVPIVAVIVISFASYVWDLVEGFIRTCIKAYK